MAIKFLSDESVDGSATFAGNVYVGSATNNGGVINLIQSIDSEIIGADIVEYNPNRDFQNMTAFLAAKMMKEILVKMI